MSASSPVQSITPVTWVRAGPVVVFNPSGLGGVTSTVRFNPLVGCELLVKPALRALRSLHDEGALEFRRGRGITVSGTAKSSAKPTSVEIPCMVNGDAELTAQQAKAFEALARRRSTSRVS